MILILENDPAFRKSLATWLVLEGFSVQTAGDGIAGLQLIRSQHPDAVICDLDLPKLNGLDVLKTLRQNASVADTAFLLMSSNPNDKMRCQAQKLGANGFLEKRRMWIQLSLILKSCLSNQS
ncbi:PleD family two-component system response regulator [Leptolyngbya sp. 7M]|uniref:response regulator n=1 Tax=Leptolyngbya sp. 7M TaxID=2812896 RepID=UPI001B8C64B8|nr:response regulator [Leptolyngbya sp. 7M]QYO63140.1 response regulator [Leptolyngbya sp. 7M]